MEVRLDSIFTKRGDFKICLNCNCINWYENEVCRICNRIQFNNSRTAVTKWVDTEYDFWNSEGLKEKEIDRVIKEV